MARDSDNNRKPSTLAAQAMGWLDPASSGVSPSIQPSTTYARDENYEKVDGRSYTRDENPTYLQAEALLTAVEEGQAARLFSSGMAAASAAMMALSPGDHVIAPAIMYHGLRSWLVEVGQRWGLDVEFVPPGDVDAIAAALRPGATKLVWIETPCNPTLEITDIAAAADVAHSAGAKLAVDSTVATPVLTRPLTLGADLVMHSATKFLNGHSDVLAGALVTAAEDEWWERIHALRHQNGAMLGPFEAWLLLRGMRTLFLRVERSCRSALAIARHFVDDRRVVEVLYPGLGEHPGHEVASTQMEGGYGGVLSVRVAGGAEAALSVAKSVKTFVPATSLGGVESLIEHRASVEGENSPIPADLLRLSIGIEDTDDLIADLDQALGA